jgi:L-aspartate oxidase
MLTAALCIATAAATRCESRGVHFRTDHPQPRDEWACHVDLRRCDEGIQATTSPVSRAGS